MNAHCHIGHPISHNNSLKLPWLRGTGLVVLYLQLSLLRDVRVVVQLEIETLVSATARTQWHARTHDQQCWWDWPDVLKDFAIHRLCCLYLSLPLTKCKVFVEEFSTQSLTTCVRTVSGCSTARAFPSQFASTSRSAPAVHDMVGTQAANVRVQAHLHFDNHGLERPCEDAVAGGRQPAAMAGPGGGQARGRGLRPGAVTECESEGWVRHDRDCSVARYRGGPRARARGVHHVTVGGRACCVAECSACGTVKPTCICRCACAAVARVWGVLGITHAHLLHALRLCTCMRVIVDNHASKCKYPIAPAPG